MESTKTTTFSKRLKQVMDLKGIRGTSLADALHIHKSLIYRYLSGDVIPMQDKFDDIAKYFHVSHGWLMGYDVDMYDHSDIRTMTMSLLNAMDDTDVIEVYNFAKKMKEVKK